MKFCSSGFMKWSCSSGFRAGVLVRMRTDGRTLKLLHRLTEHGIRPKWIKSHSLLDLFPFVPFIADIWISDMVLPITKCSLSVKDLRKVLKDSKMCPPARVSWSYILDKIYHMSLFVQDSAFLLKLRSTAEGYFIQVRES